MTKKLMVLAAGALAVVAFMAVPGTAAAGEFLGTCEGGGTCTGTISTTEPAVLEESNGLRITCSNTTGTATQPNASSKGTAKFTFSGCKESIFSTSCQNVATAGVIETNSLTSDLVLLEKEPKTTGVLLTGVNTTFKCPALGQNKTVTGNLIGEIESPECGVASTKTTVKFEAGATTGSQKWTQVTTAGTVFDLITNNDAGGAYSTSSQTGTGTITWNKKVLLDC